MHETPCPGRTSAPRPKLKKELVRRAEIEAKTCFAASQGDYMKKSRGSSQKVQLQFPRFPELIEITATDFDSIGINSL